jgi:signal transduction histidine kinase
VVVLGAARRRLPLTAAALTVLTLLACLAVAAVLDRRLTQLGRRDLHQLDGGGDVVFLFAAVSACLVGAVLLVRRPGHPAGWCFAALGLSVAVAGMAQSYGLLGLIADPGEKHLGAGFAATLADSLFVLWLTLIGLVCYLTPTGHHLSARWAWCARLLWVSGGIWFLASLFVPAELESPFRGIQNPVGVDALDGPLHVVASVAAPINNLLVLLSFGSLAVRFRRSVGDERRQLLWLGLLVVPVPVFVTVAYAAAKSDNDALVNLAAGGFVALLPLAVGLAVAKVRLYDIDRILSRAVSYLLLSAVLAGTYAGVVLLVGQGVGGAAGSSTVAVALATLAVVTLARPAYRTLQDAVDRRFSRRRYDALRVVRAHVTAPDAAITIEQVLRDALCDQGLSVSYWVQDRQAWVTGEGHAVRPAASGLTVQRGGRPVAQVSAVAAEPELVHAVLREAQPELDNAGLRAAVALQLEEVRESRTRLATAQLQERRRVERDLHDGAQQRLLALAAQLQAALLNGDPARCREALAIGVEQSQAVVRELRELANGLHPSVLTDGGLAAALDDLASRHPIDVDVAEPDRRCPPRVEATAWFIACEAVANAVKHADAERVQVHVSHAGSDLQVVVEDDGHGGADPSGGGLRGLADRAEAVGGHFSVLPRQPNGTTVRAVLPCGW